MNLVKMINPFTFLLLIPYSNFSTFFELDMSHVNIPLMITQSMIIENVNLDIVDHRIFI